MPLRHVYQPHHNGCFIAALAMLLGKTYDETFKLVHPTRNPTTDDHVYECKSKNISKEVIKALGKLSLDSKKLNYKRIKSIVKYARKNVLLIIRWGGGSACHCIVFDVETKRFLDPSGQVYEGNLRPYHQRQLDSMYYVGLPKAA